MEKGSTEKRHKMATGALSGEIGKLKMSYARLKPDTPFREMKGAKKIKNTLKSRRRILNRGN